MITVYLTEFHHSLYKTKQQETENKKRKDTKQPMLLVASPLPSRSPFSLAPMATRNPLSDRLNYSGIFFVVSVLKIH